MSQQPKMTKEEEHIRALYTVLNNITALFCAFNGQDYTTVSDAKLVLQEMSTLYNLPIRASLAKDAEQHQR